jgi:hypothetical protein
MLRAYRKTFMGTMNERWKEVVDLRPALRVPVALVVGGLLCYGFFPQSLGRMVTPTFQTYLSANRSHLTNTRSCSHGAVRRLVALAKNEEDAPPAFAELRRAKQGRGYKMADK